MLIVGGGPAGSTAAALLAERGRRVVLLEKHRHPRFHIGESLLPRNLAIFERLGVTEQVSRLGVHKPGAEFASDRTGESVFFRFADALDAVHKHAFHVPRAPFDAMLVENARSRGADIREATLVTDIAFGAEGAVVTARCADGSSYAVRAAFVLDASGRDTFLASRFRLKEADKRNSSAAVYAHFRSVEARCGEHAGYITAHFAENGWFWMIPLPDGVMSVGFVGNQAAFKGRGGDLTGLFEERIRASPTVGPRMVNAERISAVTATGNYSYRARSAWGERYMMIGDAFAFLDPIFSTGVLLAMDSAEQGAEVADRWIDDPVAGRSLARRMERRQRRTLNVFGWLIYRINTPALRMLFMSPSNRFNLRDGLIAMLAGTPPTGARQHGRVLLFKVIYHIAAVVLRYRTAQKAGDPAPIAQSPA